MTRYASIRCFLYQTEYRRVKEGGSLKETTYIKQGHRLLLYNTKQTRRKGESQKPRGFLTANQCHSLFEAVDHPRSGPSTNPIEEHNLKSCESFRTLVYLRGTQSLKSRIKGVERLYLPKHSRQCFPGRLRGENTEHEGK